LLVLLRLFMNDQRALLRSRGNRVRRHGFGTGGLILAGLGRGGHSRHWLLHLYAPFVRRHGELTVEARAPVLCLLCRVLLS